MPGHRQRSKEEIISQIKQHRHNRTIVLEDPNSELKFDIHDQAFIFCAVDEMKLTGLEDLNDAFWGYEGGSRRRYIASTLKAIANIIRNKPGETEDDSAHWNAVEAMARNPSMHKSVEDCMRKVRPAYR